MMMHRLAYASLCAFNFYRFTEDLEKYRERSRLTEVQNRFTNTAEPAYYRGLRMVVPPCSYLNDRL